MSKIPTLVTIIQNMRERSMMIIRKKPMKSMKGMMNMRTMTNMIMMNIKQRQRLRNPK
jgi:hypothetical protein